MDYTKCHTTITRYNLGDKATKILTYNKKRFKAHIYSDAANTNFPVFASTPYDIAKNCSPYTSGTPLLIIGPYDWYASTPLGQGSAIVDVVEYIQD